MLLLLISIIAGILTILAPCVLPAIPIIIGGSIGGGKHSKARPYIVGASLAVSIIVFTLLLKVSTILINLPPEALNLPQPFRSYGNGSSYSLIGRQKRMHYLVHRSKRKSHTVELSSRASLWARSLQVVVQPTLLYWHLSYHGVSCRDLST